MLLGVEPAGWAAVADADGRGADALAAGSSDAEAGAVVRADAAPRAAISRLARWERCTKTNESGVILPRPPGHQPGIS